LPERKVLALADAKLAGDGNGRLSGLASTFGNIDSYGDTVVPGAYKSTIQDFLRDGFIAWSHDWAHPVATPEVARETADGLWIEAEFHSDPESQRIRGLVAERLARGKSMGLSIGYEAKGFDFAEMDGRQVRRLLDIGLMEVSLVMVPADPQARLSRVKQADDKAEGKPWDIVERDGEFCVVNSTTGRSMGCHPTRAEAENHRRALYANVEDAGAGAAEAKVGARLSRASRGHIQAAITALQALLGEDDAAAAADDGKAADGTGDTETRATWTQAYVNDLPDSAFAVILPGGKKDGEGKTTPRSLRKLPHHNADGGLDMAHLRNALSREPQADMPDAAHRTASAHLAGHARGAGVGDGKAPDDLIAGLKVHAAALRSFDDEALLAAREPLVTLLADLSAVRGDLEAIEKRASDIGAENPRELFRQFRRLEGLYAPIHDGQRAG
jgi:HK97 family phage prohead protease